MVEFEHNEVKYTVKPVSLRMSELAGSLVFDICIIIGIDVGILEDKQYDYSEVATKLPNVFYTQVSNFTNFMLTTQFEGDSIFKGYNISLMKNVATMYRWWIEALDSDDALYTKWLAAYEEVNQLKNSPLSESDAKKKTKR